MTGNQRFDTRHYTHRHTTIDRSYYRHRPTTLKVTSRLHDYEHKNQITINTNSSACAGPSLPPLIHPSINTSNASPINTGPKEDNLQYFEQGEKLSKQKTENQKTLRKVKHRTDKMAPKQTRSAAKTKEL